MEDIWSKFSHHTKIKERDITTIHYTPDSLFAPGLSNLCFKNAIKEYDYIVTTKTQDLDLYRKYNAKKIILSQQGFDPSVHKQITVNLNDNKFISDVVFIGHLLKDRQNYLEHLMAELEVNLKIFGTGWDSFKVRRI